MPSYLAEALDELAEGGLLTLDDQGWGQRVSLTDAGQARYAQLSGSTPIPGARSQWCDADGTRITLFCQVEQVAESTEPTVLPSRLHQQGQVVGRSRESLYVCFADHQVISVAPRLVRVLDTAT